MRVPSVTGLGKHVPTPSRRTKDAMKGIPKIRSLSDAVDVAMELPATRVDEYTRKLIASHPDASIADLQAIATRTYISRAGTLSGVVGASAAIPGTGTAVATTLTAGELSTFYLNTTLYVLTMAELQGVPATDLDQRRLLVSTSLLGEEGAKLVSDQLGLSSLAWARSQLKHLSSPTLRSVNKALTKYAAKRTAKTASRRMVGRLLPFGLGAAVGYFSGRKIAQTVVEGIRTSLGDAPAGTGADVLARMNANQPAVETTR
ncbi:MAG: hypothetical protein E7A62_04510 [Actinomycetaceae bacterium]|nr:hypothetical protein [Actinomycetaceae bacterium]MDU0970247.1 hypothetical protein [Actinomycetaceae bacterium]